MHVRRTDYSLFLADDYDGQLVSAIYFKTAMDIFRQKFDKKYDYTDSETADRDSLVDAKSDRRRWKKSNNTQVKKK
jgi:hypothetical protein